MGRKQGLVFVSPLAMEGSVEREGTVETACAVSQAVITALSCSDDRYATDHNPTTAGYVKKHG